MAALRAYILPLPRRQGGVLMDQEALRVVHQLREDRGGSLDIHHNSRANPDSQGMS